MDNETLGNCVWKQRRSLIVRHADYLVAEYGMSHITSEKLIENFELARHLMAELFEQHRPQGKRQGLKNKSNFATVFLV